MSGHFHSLPVYGEVDKCHLFRVFPTGAVPPMALAAQEGSEPHHTLAFIALVLCFQPESSPGYCWPFQGSQSEVLIRLPAKIQPTAITVQHTLKTDSLLRTISSAPRDFTVFVSLLSTGGWDPAVWESCNRDLLVSAHLPRFLCFQALPFSEGAFQGTCGTVSPQDLLSAFWPSTSRLLSNTQPEDSAAGAGGESHSQICQERFLVAMLSLNFSHVLYLQGTG